MWVWTSTFDSATLTVTVALHRRPDPLGPFEMPLSQLSSATPTHAGPSVRLSPL